MKINRKNIESTLPILMTSEFLFCIPVKNNMKLKSIPSITSKKYIYITPIKLILCKKIT